MQTLRFFKHRVKYDRNISIIRSKYELYRFQWLQKVRISVILKSNIISVFGTSLFVACNLVSVKYGDKKARVEVRGSSVERQCEVVSINFLDYVEVEIY